MQVAIDGTYNNRGVDYKDGGNRNYQQEFTDTLLFANKYVGFHHRPAESPGAWVAFRENDTTLAANGMPEEARRLKNHTGDYTFLMERLPDKSYGKGITKVGPDEKRFGAWARVLPAREEMRLRLDAALVESCKNLKVKVSVTYFDAKGRGFDVIIGGTPYRLECSGQNRWETKGIEIEAPG
ncbi:MAG: hypothetical protein HC900_06685 [Methylacidiphilales bacterium]|nr:hypothetical protein [Candidatus Methylacidiphilales bacterium]